MFPNENACAVGSSEEIGMLEGVNPFTERHFSMPDSRIMGGIIK
jgi:hypothetical protein